MKSVMLLILCMGCTTASATTEPPAPEGSGPPAPSAEASCSPPEHRIVMGSGENEEFGPEVDAVVVTYLEWSPLYTLRLGGCPLPEAGDRVWFANQSNQFINVWSGLDGLVESAPPKHAIEAEFDGEAWAPVGLCEIGSDPLRCAP